MDRHRIPVLVLGTGVTVLGVVRSLGRAGIPAYCTCPPGDFAAHSRWSHRARAGFEEFSPVEDLIAFLESSRFERIMLMPCSDWWARTVGGLDPSPDSRYPWVGSSTAVMDCLADKEAFADLARAHGIPHPLTVRVGSAADLADLPVSPGAEFFLKARDSQAFTVKLGVKAYHVSSVNEARQRVAEAAQAGLGVVLQEYIPGPATNHYFLDGFVDRTGAVRARFARQRLRMNPPLFGNSTYMRSIALADAADIVATVDRVIAASGLRGIFSVELKRDARDGVAKVLDVNARPWWYIEFATQCGVNVCELAYRDALGMPLPAQPAYTVGRTCVFPVFDYAGCVRLHRAGELSLGDWMRSWLQADQPIFSWRDPLPAVFRAGQLTGAFIRSRLRRLVGGGRHRRPGPSRTA
jgi:predicted ATP-grasp superfamily ATP-dependent carboligase